MTAPFTDCLRRMDKKDLIVDRMGLVVPQYVVVALRLKYRYVGASTHVGNHPGRNSALLTWKSLSLDNK